MKRNRHKSFFEKYGLRPENGDFTQVPNILLQNPSVLGLKPGDLELYLYIDSYPHEYFHAVSVMSKALGIHPNTLRARIRRLEKLGYLHRKYERGSANIYDFKGLRNGVRTMLIIGDTGIQKLDSPRSKFDEYNKQILYTNKDNTNKERYVDRTRIRPRTFRRSDV